LTAISSQLGLRLRGALRATPFGIAGGVIALALLVLSIAPLATVAWRAFVVDGKLDLSAFSETATMPGLGTTLLNTLVMVLASGATSLTLGTALAWLNERTDARLGIVTDALPLVAFVLPPIAGAVAWVMLLSPEAGYVNVLIREALSPLGIALEEGPLDIYSWYGLIFVYTIYQVPFAFLLVSAALRNMDPALEEASRVCGCGVVKTLRKVTIPALLPTMAGAALLVTWTSLGLYSVPAVIGTGAEIEVLTVRIVNVVAFTYPARTDLAVGLSLIMIAIVAVVWFAQSRVTRHGRHATVEGKGRAATPISLGRWRTPTRILMIGYAVLTTVVPMIALALVSLNGYWTPNIRWAHLSLEPFQRQVLDNPVSREALTNSLTLGLLGATIAMLAAAIVSLYLLRRPAAIARVIDGAIKLPPTLSHVVLAVGFVLLLAGPPFNLAGTTLILLIAYVALYYPQGSVAADGAVSQVGQELSEASSVAGAGQTRTFRRIYLPLMVPGLIAGWALLFVRMVGDLSASALLAGSGNPVVGRQILEIFQNGSFSLLASLAMALTAISAVVVVVLMALSRRNARWSVGHSYSVK